MKQCTLCGGRLANGICVECGLNNKKGDGKYRLNVHNEKSEMFQHEVCEENLNRERKAENLIQKRKEENLSREREMVKRVQTDREKKTGVVRAIVWIGVVATAIELVGALAAGKLPEEEIFADTADDAMWEDDDYGFAEPEETLVKPEWINWDETSENYYEAELTPGCYYAGYDIPVGKYQLYCKEGTAWLYWWTRENIRGTGVSLQSLEYQKEMERYGLAKRAECSEVLTLREGSGICLENCESPLLIKGEKTGKVKEYKPQNLPQEVTLEGGMVVGEDFPAGVYDFVMESRDPEEDYVELYINMVKEEEGRYYTVMLDSDQQRFLRFPFEEGLEITELEKYAEDAEVKLIPSY